MNAQLTAKQTEALQKIQDNPGRIVVFTNNPDLSWDQRIHGNVSNALYARGYIEGYNPETGRSYHEEENGDASLWYSGKYYLRLTAAGREALGVFDNLSPTAQAVAEASVIRDQAMLVAYKAEGTSREAEADAAYEAADAAYRKAGEAHRAACDAFREDPTAREADTIPRQPKEAPRTAVAELEYEYQNLVLIGRGLRLLSDSMCLKLADMKDLEGLDELHPRRVKAHAKLMQTLDLEDANLKAREALSIKIRETRIRNAYNGEKPFHLQVKDAINLKW